MAQVTTTHPLIDDDTRAAIGFFFQDLATLTSSGDLLVGVRLPASRRGRNGHGGQGLAGQPGGPAAVLASLALNSLRK